MFIERVIRKPGELIIDFIRYMGALSILFGQTMYHLIMPPFNRDRFLYQARRVGPGSFLIAGIIAFFIGMIIALQMAYQMVKLSAELYIPSVVAESISRELGPVLTALIVAGRIGAGVTAELGSMTVTEQVDALRAFAVNPVKYLVVPRFLALVVMLPLLTIFADMIGILGGFVICVNKLSISTSMFWEMAFQTLSLKDISTGLIKSLAFAMIISIVGCYYGLNVKGGADGVGRATTMAVVVSFVMIIITDCMLTVLFYFILN